MSRRSKREYIEAVFLRYRHASREKKTLILDEFCETLGCHRKHAIRILRGFKRFTAPKPKKRGRSPVYRAKEILEPLKRIWRAANLPCSKRLKAILPLWLAGYSQSFGPLSPQVIKALRSISPATIDRVLKPVRSTYKKHGRATTKPGTLLAGRYRSRPTSGTRSGRGFWKRIRWPIAGNPYRACLPIRSIVSI